MRKYLVKAKGLGEAVEYKICPSCGSSYLVSARNADKVVFHVDEVGQLSLVSDHNLQSAESDIDPYRIYCGVCSWSGALADLAISHD